MPHRASLKCKNPTLVLMLALKDDFKCMSSDPKITPSSLIVVSRLDQLSECPLSFETNKQIPTPTILTENENFSTDVYFWHEFPLKFIGTFSSLQLCAVAV